VRILYLCHRIPYPPDKGEKIRAFHQLQAIAKRHEVDLFTLADDPADLERGPAALRGICQHVTVAQINPRLARLRSFPYLFTSTPLTIPYFGSADLRDRIRHAVGGRSYDLVFVYCSAMAQYLEPARGIPVVTDLVDVDSDKWAQYAAFARFPMSAIYRREARAMREYERAVCERSSTVVVTTEREAQLLREISPAASVHVMTNGVDTEYFKPFEVRRNGGAPVIGFVGDMAYFPNQEAVTFFAHKVLPLIRTAAPEARFLIVGRNPGPAVRDLARIDGIEVTGFVPDVRPHLERMWVSVAPFSVAAGIQNKILEAMASGIPVVATARAAQGLTRDAAAAVQIADGPEQIASRTVELLRDPQFAREKGLESRRRVAADYSWERSLQALLRILEGSFRAEAATAGLPPSVV
jgi:sugar transferase (PEP-CTERM/EpsH1 system associated)